MTRGGRRYLDFDCGIAVNALGHAHPHLVEALKEQADKLWHVSNIYRNSRARNGWPNGWSTATFADKVFFTNSGAEAIECAIKTARRYYYAKGEPERYRHHRLRRLLPRPHARRPSPPAASPNISKASARRLPASTRCRSAISRRSKAPIDDKTAAILIEPVQGEGGVRAMPDEFLRGLRELCDEHGLLLILDEVQCGMGRTGKLFAHEWSGITPDIMAIAKGIGGGFPLGACLATERGGQAAWCPARTARPIGGNPLAMAVGNAVLDVVLDDGFLEHVREMALLLQAGPGVDSPMRYPDVIEAMRGKGLMHRHEVPGAQHRDRRGAARRASAGRRRRRQCRAPAAAADRHRRGHRAALSSAWTRRCRRCCAAKQPRNDELEAE